MEPVRLGVVGCGVIGTVHAKAAKEAPNVSLVALADLRADALQKLASDVGVKKAYTTAEALFEDAEVEAVVLALPACGRLALALEAFAKGKHVLTEKPVAMCADDVRTMIAARGRLVAGCCSSRNRFGEHAEAVTKFIATGALGPVRFVRARGTVAASAKPETFRPAWRLRRDLNGGGIAMNWGCYDLDYVLGLTGWTLRPKTVLARTWTIPRKFASHIVADSDAETHAVALVVCEGGAALEFERGEYMTAPADGDWQIIGEDASLTLNMLAATPDNVILTVADEAKGCVRETVWSGQDERGAVGRRLLADFARAVRENGRPRTSLEQSLVVQQITDAIYRSAETGRAVDIQY